MNPPETLTYIIEKFSVPRETIDRLETYHRVLCKWQKAINLISQSTLENAWERHFLDSVQLVSLIDNHKKRVIDIGSGAGFPGMVLAIMGYQVTLVESDARKVAFLREVANQTAIDVDIINKRVESLDIGVFDIVTSRACASLQKLLGYSHPFFHADTLGIFHKGEKLSQELAEARQAWDFSYKTTPSIIENTSSLVQISALQEKAT